MNRIRFLKPGSFFLRWIFPAALLLFTANSCTRLKGCTDPAALNYDSGAQVNDGSCYYYGYAMFYFDAPGPVATVIVNTSPVTQGLVDTTLSGTVTCGDSLCANFTLAPGTYTDTAYSTLFSWLDTFTVTSKGCVSILLPQSTGYITFWCSNILYGSITVTIDNRISTIVGFPSTAPACGASDCANFLLPTGSFSYTATSVSGHNWGPTNVTINQNACTVVQLQ